MPPPILTSDPKGYLLLAYQGQLHPNTSHCLSSPPALFSARPLPYSVELISSPLSLGALDETEVLSAEMGGLGLLQWLTGTARTGPGGGL